MQGRPAPGGLTYGLIEGLLMQGMVQGTGLALLEVHKKVLKPVMAGDTIWAEVEVTDIKPTSKHNRAVMTSRIDVKNQDGIDVMAYTAVRIFAGEASLKARLIPLLIVFGCHVGRQQTGQGCDGPKKEKS